MIRRPTTRRPAVALLEVLIGLGIMIVALTSLIVLFPFSSLSIAKALKDDRGTTAAINGDALLRDVHNRYVVEPGPGTQEPYFWVMDNPADPRAQNGAVVVAGSPPPLPAQSPTSTGPSYPVYLDPMGMVALRGPVGDPSATLPLGVMIPRVNFNFVIQSGNPNTVSLRVASQMDGLSYTSDGVVQSGANMRELRYNIAWMLQRPSNADRYTVRQQVIVYDRRAHLYKPPGSEAVYSGIPMTPGDTTIGGVPNTAEIRKGTWILDAGNPVGIATATPPQPPLLQAEFYRVISATDAGNGTYTLEVHKPIVRSDGQTGPTAGYTTNLVVIPGICDVFERPMLTAGIGP
jgi:hypothetical protein